MISPLMPVVFYKGGFMKVKELAAKYRLHEETMRLYIRDAGIDLKGKQFLSPKQINAIIAEYGEFE